MRLAVWLCLLLAGARLAAADDLAARVVILANAREPESVGLAEFYAAQRGIPAANVVALPLPADESISWRQFIDQVWQPLQDELYRRGWLEGTPSTLLDRYGRRRYAFTNHRLSYLVTCRGVPLRIYEDPTLPDASVHLDGQFKKTEGAVDSELSLLAWGNYDPVGPLANPLFAHNGPQTLDATLVIKVSRLDGPTWEDARRLVTSAIAGERSGPVGRYYVDLGGPHPEGDAWLKRAEATLRELGLAGDVETTPATFAPDAPFDRPLFYFGWYAADCNGPFLQPGFTFPPGAVAEHIHSFSAQTLRSATSGWVGPLVARGVTATVGNVFEPDLKLLHRPDLLVAALGRGQTFGDAAYYALPALSWQAIAVGDPLYRPFRPAAGRR
jgi:uncharacterized protein (TIGR03790 family)